VFDGVCRFLEGLRRSILFLIGEGRSTVKCGRRVSQRWGILGLFSWHVDWKLLNEHSARNDKEFFGVSSNANNIKRRFCTFCAKQVWDETEMQIGPTAGTVRKNRGPSARVESVLGLYPVKMVLCRTYCILWMTEIIDFLNLCTSEKRKWFEEKEKFLGTKN
jgi:hypothetical protein